jgi:hypothetical protein
LVSIVKYNNDTYWAFSKIFLGFDLHKSNCHQIGKESPGGSMS